MSPSATAAEEQRFADASSPSPVAIVADAMAERLTLDGPPHAPAATVDIPTSSQSAGTTSTTTPVALPTTVADPAGTLMAGLFPSPPESAVSSQHSSPGGASTSGGLGSSSAPVEGKASPPNLLTDVRPSSPGLTSAHGHAATVDALDFGQFGEALLSVSSAREGGGIGGDGGEIPNDPGKMFIGGLSWQTTPESIREYFSMFGELAEVMVMKDPATRRSRGFGFISFSDPAAVEKVLSFPLHQLDGKMVEPKVAVPRKTNPKLVMRTKKIFVGGLSATTSLEDVKAYFEQFSKVKDAMLAYDKVTNRHRGFGFITFDNDEVVDKICEIHFHEINGE